MSKRLNDGVVIAGFVAANLLVGTNTAQSEGWLQFRGANPAGVYEGNVPTDWGAAEHLKWAIPLPGKAVSSPIVAGNRVFVTSYSGFGQDPNKPGDLADLRRYLVCIDRIAGEVLWDRSPPTRFPEDQFEGFITDHGYASCTPASDGERVYAFFGKSGVHAFDFDGELLWQPSLRCQSSCN